MPEAGRFTISASDILAGGPVESVLTSVSGASGHKRFAVVTNLDTGIAYYAVEAGGETAGFPLDQLTDAVEFFNAR
jgi:hypothetical protein